MKGQLFTADVLASLLIVTIIVAFTTWEFEQVYSRSSDVQYDKLNSLASDIGQMAAKNILANRSGTVIRANWIEPGRWALLRGNMSEMLLPPLGYEASVSGGFSGSAITGNGGCPSTKANIAVARRLVYFRGASGEMPTLTIKVCA
jgi:hypothetical protein